MGHVSENQNYYSSTGSQGQIFFRNKHGEHLLPLHLEKIARCHLFDRRTAEVTKGGNEASGEDQ